MLWGTNRSLLKSSQSIEMKINAHLLHNVIIVNIKSLVSREIHHKKRKNGQINELMKCLKYAECFQFELFFQIDIM